MTEELLVGIDPGLTGAIAVLSDNKIIFHDMPLCDQKWSAWKTIIKTGTKYRQQKVDPRRLWEILEGLRKLPHKITIEAVTPLPTYGAATAWRFSGAFYTAVSICEILGLNLHFVTASSWKRSFNFIGMGKDAPRQAALKMYPHLEKELGLKKYQDRADALFIALSKYDV